MDENGMRRTLRRNNFLCTTTSESVIKYVNAFLRTTPINIIKTPKPTSPNAAYLRREPADESEDSKRKLTPKTKRPNNTTRKPFQTNGTKLGLILISCFG
jgi:hypothetical protein